MSMGPGRRGMAVGTLAGDIREAEGGIPGRRRISRRWRWWTAGPEPGSESGSQGGPADDIAFFNQMLDYLGTKFSVDSSRIYAAGLSEGGFMSMRVGCALGDRIAAIAAVGAAMPKTMICLPTRPVPPVMINGTSDPVVPYGGGTDTI